MTMTSNQASAPIDTPDLDQRPGSSDIAWAERAYLHQEREQASERRRVPRAPKRRLRMLVAALVIVVGMAGLVVAMRYVGSSPSPIVTQPTSSQTATAPQSTTALSPFTLTSPLRRPFPFLHSTIETQNR
jgi:hypothetical protein